MTSSVVRSARAACKKRRHLSADFTSTAARGSSTIRTAGRAASARTSATWAAWPPDKAGTGTSASSYNPAAARSSCARVLSRVTMATASTAVERGGRPGRWVSKTTSAHSGETSPPLRRPAMRPIKVVLPEPFGPTTAVMARGEKSVRTPSTVTDSAGASVGRVRARSLSTSISCNLLACGW